MSSLAKQGCVALLGYFCCCLYGPEISLLFDIFSILVSFFEAAFTRDLFYCTNQSLLPSISTAHTDKEMQDSSSRQTLRRSKGDKGDKEAFRAPHGGTRSPTTLKRCSQPLHECYGKANDAEHPADFTCRSEVGSDLIGSRGVEDVRVIVGGVLR